MRSEFFENSIDEKHMGSLYGLGGTYKKKPGQHVIHLIKQESLYK